MNDKINEFKLLYEGKLFINHTDRLCICLAIESVDDYIDLIGFKYYNFDLNHTATTHLYYSELKDPANIGWNFLK